MSLPVMDRIHLTKFRISNHRLQMELGRYRGLPVKERVCPNCHVIEDEVHFLLSCNLYALQRQILLSNVGMNPDYPKDINFINVMKSNDDHILSSLGVFISKAFRARDIHVKYLPKYF